MTPPGSERVSRGFSRQTVFLVAVVVVSLLVYGTWGFFGQRGADGRAPATVSSFRLEQIPFNGARAYEHLQQLCALGRRPSGSPGMAAQQKLLAEHFQSLGAQVEFQRFTSPHPEDGSPVPMANLLVHWHPQSTQRILLCTHYDTLPYPMLDPVDPRGTFVGANDGGSGTALLMELGREIPSLKIRWGVDFVFFDAEEFLFRPDGKFFLGSEHFARRYVKDRPPYRYLWAVLLDMIGDADLQLYQEVYSTRWRDSRPLVDGLWRTARRLGVREFIAQPKYEVMDDHLALHDIAGIPACNVIDFDYPAWHTQADRPERCSALSLAKVGWVLLEWLKQQR